MSVRDRSQLIQKLNRMYFELQELALSCNQWGAPGLAKRMNEIAIEIGEMPDTVKKTIRYKRSPRIHITTAAGDPS
jgi:hypothetical protein